MNFCFRIRFKFLRGFHLLEFVSSRFLVIFLFHPVRSCKPQILSNTSSTQHIIILRRVRSIYYLSIIIIHDPSRLIQCIPVLRISYLVTCKQVSNQSLLLPTAISFNNYTPISIPFEPSTNPIAFGEIGYKSALSGD
jgi:hypothetical protein